MSDQPPTSSNVRKKEGHTCPMPGRGMLPPKLVEHAMKGRVREVSQWLDKGGDVNAADLLDRTMLHYASDENQEEMVKKLLEHPDVHVNTRIFSKEAYTPLTLAAMKGHLNIVNILLDTKMANCAIDLSIFVDRNPKDSGISVIMLAVQYSRWEVVKTLLKRYKSIRVWEAYHILTKVVREYQFDLAEMLIEANHPFREADFNNIIQDVYYCKKWRLLEMIFKKSVELDNDSTFRLFRIMLFQNDWDNVEKYLQILEPKAEFHKDVVEALVANDQAKVENVLKEIKENRDGIFTGTLLAACVVGTSEELAEKLVKYDGIHYSNSALQRALLLSSLHNNLEYVQTLLSFRRYSYKTIVRARNLTFEHQRVDVNDLLYLVIEERSKEYNKMQKGDDGGTEKGEI